MPTILACTDGSAHAPSVCHHAAWAARKLDAGIDLLHVLDHHREQAVPGDLSGSLGMDAGEHLTEELARQEQIRGRDLRVKGKEILEAAKACLAAAGSTRIAAIQRHGSLVETLGELEPRCDLVVLGKQGGDTRPSKSGIGGNLERVIRSAVKPVLVVGRDCREIDSFLLAYDGGPSVQKALDFLLASPLLRGSACHILRAGHVDDNARWFLAEAADKLRAAGYAVTNHVVPGGPDTVITDTIKRENISMLVMGAYGHSPIRQFFLGSTTTSMIRASPVPVLMFR
jgi:nucleotide-binding universal stress UspA family protein